jgi:hypothetical protein
MEAAQGSQLYVQDTSQSMMNAQYGCVCSGASMIGTGNGTQILGNGILDAYATDISEFAGVTGTFATSSPAPNTIGNFGALVKAV